MENSIIHVTKTTPPDLAVFKLWLPLVSRHISTKHGTIKYSYHINFEKIYLDKTKINDMH